MDTYTKFLLSHKVFKNNYNTIWQHSILMKFHDTGLRRAVPAFMQGFLADKKCVWGDSFSDLEGVSELYLYLPLPRKFTGCTRIHGECSKQHGFNFTPCTTMVMHFNERENFHPYLYLGANPLCLSRR